MAERKRRPSKLNDQQIVEIMTAPAGVNMAELARRYGVHRDTIRQIRTGKLHQHLRPDIDRLAAGRTCASCRFHAGSSGCLFRFPEFTEIGPKFAGECVTYMKICDSGRDEPPAAPQTGAVHHVSP